MVFTQREKLIIAATIAVLCLLVLDVYVLTPVLDKRAAVEAERKQLLAKFSRAKVLLNRGRLLGRKGRDMFSDGMARDPGAAESGLLRSLRDWSADVGVSLSSLRPERSAQETKLPEVIVHAAGRGSMASVSRLLWRIETARIPVRVKMLQLGSRRDGADDLSLHLKVSTLYSPTGAVLPKRAVRRIGPARGER
jgi:hypothetical protein